MLFLYRPESPLTETLRFLTQILPHKDGSEQRSCLRSGPRTEYTANFIVEEGIDRQIVENALYGVQDATWTIPAWPDVAFLSASASIGATSISVDHSLSDFRAGDSAVLIQEEGSYEVLTNITLSSGSVGFGSALTKAWPAGSEVYPLRDCLISGTVNSNRYPTNATNYKFLFAALDTGVNLYNGTLPTGSTLSFGTLGFGPDPSIFVLSDANAMGDSLNEVSDRGVKFIDAQTGKFSSFGFWNASRRISRKGFVSHTREDLWAIRVLLHALKGRTKTFLLPTFAKDFTPLAGLASGTSTLAVANAGWTGYVEGKYRKYARVELANGTHIDNQILSSVVDSGTQETLTFLNNWSSTVALGNIARVTIYEKMRIESDDITLMHQSLAGESTVEFPVRSVIE